MSAHIMEGPEERYIVVYVLMNYRRGLFQASTMMVGHGRGREWTRSGKEAEHARHPPLFRGLPTKKLGSQLLLVFTRHHCVANALDNTARSIATRHANTPTHALCQGQMAPKTLSAQQAHALFDVLTHHETHDEIQRFKYPSAIENYGPPFENPDGSPSDSPILQTLLYRFVLQLPGLKDAPPDFWQRRIQTIIKKLGDAELSESYDKGTLGSRRTLATGISTVIEYPARGVLGGLPKKPKHNENSEDYDLSDPDEVIEAWDDFLQELIYGDMMDELFQKVSETDRLEDHRNLVRCAHEYILVKLVHPMISNLSFANMNSVSLPSSTISWSSRQTVHT
jgi:hypothetical protein